jgi:FkbM family methyltransferase
LNTYQDLTKLDAPFGVKVSHSLHRMPITHYVRTPVLYCLSKTGIFRVVKTFPNGLKLALDVADKIQLDIYRRGFWEKHELTIAERLMQNGQFFVDVGAHCGSFAMPIANEFRTAKVLAFEPNPHLQYLLLQTQKLNHLDNFILDERALSNDCGPMDFYVSYGANDALAGLNPRSGASKHIEIQATTLQKALLEHQISRLRLLKIDIEGAEGIVLPASQELLAAGVIEAILLELHVDLIKKYGQTGENIIQLLHRNNYKLYQCHSLPLQDLPSNWRPLVDGSQTIHILAINQSSIGSGTLPKIWN